MAETWTPVSLALPLLGPCRVEMSPGSRVPSHGTDRGGIRYGIDLVPVDERGRSARRGWRALVATEPPESFVGFGLPVLAPIAGRVVRADDGIPDGPGYRSPLAQLRFLAGQAGRLRAGFGHVAGNRVAIRATTGALVWLLHLRQGSVSVREGVDVQAGQRIGECGSSGNSTEPHVHLHVCDDIDPERARGIPLRLAAHLTRTRTGWQPTPARVPRNGVLIRAAESDRKIVASS